MQDAVQQRRKSLKLKPFTQKGNKDMKLQLEIQGNDAFSIAEELFDSNSLQRGKTEKSLTDSVTMRYDGVPKRYAASVDSQTNFILQITIIIGQNVVLPVVMGLLSSYLYGKLKDKKTNSIKIGNTYILQISAEEIGQVIINEAKEKDSNSS
jgi:hypothetical protein